MPPLWRLDPSTLPRPRSERDRKIRHGPLIDLGALQAAIRDGTIDENSVRVVNKSCDKALNTLQWTEQDILGCLLVARAEDYEGSEWCTTTWAGERPCDAYSIPYDDQIRRRTRGPLEYYLKFSMSEDDELNIQLVRTHL